MKERRKHYVGTVEVWVNGTKRLETSARPVGYVKVSVIRPLGEPDEPFDGPASWDGHIEISEADAQAQWVNCLNSGSLTVEWVKGDSMGQAAVSRALTFRHSTSPK